MAGLLVDQSLADRMVSAALEDSTQHLGSGDTNQVLAGLRQGRCDICNIFTDHLIFQVGQYLGEMDKTVKSVFKYEPEYASLMPASAEKVNPGSRGGINLVAWVERKSAALTALGATLEENLSESRKRIQCPNAKAACYSLDIQMVEDREVNEARGFGLIVNQPFLRSVQVWQRTESQIQTGEPNIHTGSKDVHTTTLPMDLEFTPEPVLFEQALTIEQLPAAEQKPLEARLRELKVILIRRMISDQLAYINIAKEWLTISDLQMIYQRKIGNGKVGGKAAGLVLANRILKETADPALYESLIFPPSYYIGSDVIYLFMAMNGLMHWNNQKYKTAEEIHSEYPLICEEFQKGHFPPEILQQLQAMLKEMSGKPIIVRSSSQLEDNFGTSFAGKYQSFFCPNQDTFEENLAALAQAISMTYASTLNPDALLYRRNKGLQDYDERMAVLIQPVQGEIFGRYFLPFAAGVAFSRNMYRWAPQIRQEDGFARMVWGLGTHAVERSGNDYPRLVALSHPTLQPDDDPHAIRYYSQRLVDCIDLQENRFRTVNIYDALSPDYPPIRYMVQIDTEGYMATPRTRLMQDEISHASITFDELLRRTPIAANLSKVLKLLEETYQVPIDMEFTISLAGVENMRPNALLHILQCRPQSHLQAVLPAVIPQNLPEEKIVFLSHFMVPQGYLPNIRYVLFVHPQAYFSIPTQSERNQLTRAISQLNSLLGAKKFICVGPGRWGTTNPDLGVFVNYADIYNSGALVELAGGDLGPAPEPSLGTHFFQDLMEAQIYPVAIPLDDPKTSFNRSFFIHTPNRLMEHAQIPERLVNYLKLIDVEDVFPQHHLEMILDNNQNLALAYLAENQ